MKSEPPLPARAARGDVPTLTQPGPSAGLLVGIGAHVESPSDMQLLVRCVQSVRRLHDNAIVVVIDNDSPDVDLPGAAAMTNVSSLLRSFFRADASLIIQRQSPSWFAFGALSASIGVALHHQVSRFAYLQHSMQLLQPLPLSSLPCPLVAFRSFPANAWEGCTSRSGW